MSLPSASVSVQSSSLLVTMTICRFGSISRSSRERLETARARHLLVEQDEVERTTSHQLGGVVGVRRGLDLEPLVTQEHAVRLEQLRLVVDPEDGLGLVRHGSNVAVHEMAEQSKGGRG